MRRLHLALSAFALTVSLSVVSGCDSGTKVEDIKISPEAKAADNSGQKGMEDFMKTKGAGKGGAAKDAPIAPK